MRYKLRKLIGRVVRYTGLSRVRWRLLSHRLYVLNYHRVGNPEHTDFDRGTFSCHEERFRDHLAAITDRFDVIDLAALDRALRTRRPRSSTRPAALITFDDGYIDNYTTAFPLLKA